MSARSLRVGVVTTSFPRFEGDVAGNFVLGFARELVRHGHTVDVIAPEPAETRATPSWPGIDVHWVPYLRPRALQRTFYGAGVADNLARDPLAWLGGAPFLARARSVVCEREKAWDAVVSHWAFPTAWIAAAGTAARPHVAVFHSADVHALERMPGGARLAAALSQRATSLWFVSDALLQRFMAMLPTHAVDPARAHSHVCPMGVDVAKALPDRAAARRALGCEKFTVLALGRLVPIKGLDLLIDAAAALRDENIEVLIAGDGPSRAALEGHARAVNAPVRFVGNVVGDAKAQAFAAADAFAFTSKDLPSGRTEGMPTTVVEAMAAGLPVLATPVGGLASSFTNEVHLRWVRPDAADDLARQIQRLRDDTHTRARLAAGGQARSADFRWDALAPRFLPLLTAP